MSLTRFLNKEKKNPRFSHQLCDYKTSNNVYNKLSNKIIFNLDRVLFSTKMKEVILLFLIFHKEIMGKIQVLE